MADDSAPIYAIRQEIMNFRYPVKKEDIVQKVGDVKVGPLANPVPLRDVFAEVPQDTFKSEDEALRQVAEVWPKVSSG